MLDDLWDTTQFLELSKAEEQQSRDDTSKMLETYFVWSSKNKNKIKNVEKVFDLELGGKKIHGKIDRIEENPEGNLEIIDYKTGKPSDEDVEENLQLNAYALGCEKIYGVLPSKVSLFYVKAEPEERFKEYHVTKEQVETVKIEMEDLISQISNRNFTAKPGMFTCKHCDFKEICEFAQ